MVEDSGDLALVRRYSVSLLRAPPSGPLCTQQEALLASALTDSTSNPVHWATTDHGVFVPFKLMFKDASPIPIIQVSIDASLSPQKEWALGAALEELRSEGVLIISGGLTVSKASLRRSSVPDLQGSELTRINSIDPHLPRFRRLLTQDCRARLQGVRASDYRRHSC